VLAGLIIETATGRTLGRELTRRILRPLGLRDTFFPVNAPDIPGPRSRGYSLPLSPEGELLDGPLVDFTRFNPSLAWAAGNLISDLDDLARFFRALLGGRLLPPRLLAEMTSPVDTGIPGFGYGLGLTVIQAPLLPAPTGRLIGHDGGIPGFLNTVLSTQDGRRQLGVMLNELFAPDAVVEAYSQAWLTIAARLLDGAPSGVASTGASLRAAVRAGAPGPTAQALDRMQAPRPVPIRR
jgi:D-alanyl-D-alanine carboxypeptidase